MIRINNRDEIRTLLLKRSKLQEQYVKACAKTAEDHEANYIRHYKKDYNLLTVWYFLLVGYIVLLLLFYLSKAQDKTTWITILSIIGAALLAFLGLIIYRINYAKKLKKAWDEDLHQANLLRDEANKYGEHAAKLGIMIMALSEHSYILDLPESEQQNKWKQIIYEYIDAINKYYKGATIEDYLDYFQMWLTKHNLKV